METLTKPAQESNMCRPIQQEIGNDPQLLSDPNFRDVFTDMSGEMIARAVAVRPYGDRRTDEAGEALERAEAAERIVTSLGCAGCEMSDVCIVSSTLTGVASERLLYEQVYRKQLNMEAAAKTLRNSSVLFKSAYGEPLSAIVNSGGSLDTQSVADVIGLENVTVGVPEMVSDALISDDIGKINHKPIDHPRLTVRCGSAEHEIIDISDSTPQSGQSLDKREAKVLLDRLFSRLANAGSDGRPQILANDGSSQKAIDSLAGVFELRVGGSKARLYIKPLILPDGKCKVIVLGGHSGDARTQVDYIDSLVR